MVADKGKKMKLADKDEDHSSEHIDGELVLSIEKLQEVQDELEKISDEASEKVLEIEQKYSELRKPVYDKRSEVIKSIPDFWLTAFLSHPALGNLLSENDQKIFQYLSSLEVEDSEDLKSGFSIIFHFKPNPYFEDVMIKKSYTFPEEGEAEVTATSIKWKEGMGIANGANHKKKGKKREQSDESFFQWFKDDSDPDAINDEIAEIIREDLWVNPLAYFNQDDDGEPDSDEGGGEDDGSEEEDDGSEEEEEYDDE
ncbi:hypothetical protein SAY87_026330 [Trapa incisa]|uniref:NAP1-related protein 2 n=1 Tax=Trapa incisa TaxID=236973 RepID=A0AAN7JKZ8_9MYRT|nr:hypothetical protein SAY87_026330 [Trapa incisa]